MIRLNRWQPRQSRYKMQRLEVSDTSELPYLDLLFDRAVQGATDVSTKQTVMRTQRVDRILFNADGVIDVYLSPIVDRQYKQAVNSREKVGRDDVVCDTCLHREQDHTPHPRGEYKARICLVPGCRCNEFRDGGKRLERVDAVLAQRGTPGRCPHCGAAQGKCLCELELGELDSEARGGDELAAARLRDQ